jgi:hypothetical protein
LVLGFTAALEELKIQETEPVPSLVIHETEQYSLRQGGKRLLQQSFPSPYWNIFRNMVLCWRIEQQKAAVLPSMGQSSEICIELTPVRAKGEAALSARD